MCFVVQFCGECKMCLLFSVFLFFFFGCVYGQIFLSSLYVCVSVGGGGGGEGGLGVDRNWTGMI